MMLIRFSLPSSNPITLLYTVHPLSDTESIIGKSRKVENPDFSRSAPPQHYEQLKVKYRLQLMLLCLF